MKRGLWREKELNTNQIMISHQSNEVFIGLPHGYEFNIVHIREYKYFVQKAS